MSITSKVLDAIGLGEKSALKKFHELCQREAVGELPAGDAEKLRGIMADCGKTSEDFRRIVSAHRRREELKPIAAKLDAATDAFIEIDKRRELWWSTVYRPISPEFKTEFQVMNSHKEKLQAEHDKARNELSLVLDAVAELDQIENEFADALSIPPEARNLDLFTLEYRSINGGTTINICAPDAKRRFVSFATFQRESYRRQDLMDAARAAAHEVWNTAMLQWTERCHKSVRDGRGFSSEPEPERFVPTWADVLKDLSRYEKLAAEMRGKRAEDEEKYTAGNMRGMEAVY